MKAAFPTKEMNPTMDSILERVFGDAKTYIIVGSNIDNYIVVENRPHTAEGCHMGKVFQQYEVDTVVSCELCEHCMKNLRDLNIDTWKCDGSVNVRESYNKFILGGIFSRTTPDIVECEHSKLQAQMTT